MEDADRRVATAVWDRLAVEKESIRRHLKNRKRSVVHAQALLLLGMEETINDVGIDAWR